MRTTALTRKLFRDIAHLRGHFFAVGLVVASGVALFVTLRSMHGFLGDSLNEYYHAYRFANVFASLKRAPRTIEPQIAAIPGVETIETRIVFDVVLDVPGLPEPATGRLVSIPDDGQPPLNALHLTQGRWIDPHADGEVLASEAFAQANALQVGDSVGAVLNGRWKWLHIVGIALSPEYVYEIGGGGSILPDNRRFGVLWMGNTNLAAAFDMKSEFNDVALSLAPGASEADVIGRLDHLLTSYGSQGAYGRDDQLSHRFVSSEIEETQITSIIIPSIFLAVTAFLVHLVMSRLIATQRDQIATLKAFGYHNVTLGVHYLELALVPVLAGALVGTGFGLWFATRLAIVYARFYRFPLAHFEPQWTIVAAAIAIGGGAALVGAVGAARRATALPPAEGMRPEAPTRFRPGPLERLGFEGVMSPAARMVVRNIERRPGKALLGVLGIALAVAIVVAGRYTFDAIDMIMHLQFDEIQRGDITVTFTTPLEASALGTLEHLPGVLRAEPFRIVPVRLRHLNHTKRTAIMGIQPGSELYRIVGVNQRPLQPPDNGLLLTDRLAKTLDVRPGDAVTVDVLEGKEPTRDVVVAGTVDELVGVGTYMSMTSLSHLVDEPATLSGAYLSVDTRIAPELYTRLKRLPAVNGVSVRNAEIASFNQTIAESFRISLLTIIAFASIIAAGVVYNGARVALSERGRELASLRVLGFTRGETASMLLGEQALLTALSLIPGLLIGYALCWLMVQRFTSDLFRLPLVLSTTTYAFAFLVVTAAAVVSAELVRRRINHLDLIEVLKTRE